MDDLLVLPSEVEFTDESAWAGVLLDEHIVVEGSAILEVLHVGSSLAVEVLSISVTSVGESVSHWNGWEPFLVLVELRLSGRDVNLVVDESHEDLLLIKPFIHLFLRGAAISAASSDLDDQERVILFVNRG